MSGIPGDVDRYGLVALFARWTPKGMKSSDAARRLLTAFANQNAHGANILVAAERYLPIILNPRRCLDDDLFRSLELNGVRVRPGSLSFSQVRRLAMMAPDLRAWRGAFLSHRALAASLTGRPVILRSWVQQRAVMDESGMDVVLLDEDDADYTQVFVVTQGPDADQEYSEAELLDRLEELAMPALDGVQLIDCFALTAWRNGVGGWVPQAGVHWPEAVPGRVEFEFESADMGPDVSADALQYVRSPTEAPEPSGSRHSWWVTVWFHTSGVPTGETWDLWLLSDEDGPDGGSGYVVRVPVGPLQDMEFIRVESGVELGFGTHAVTFNDGDSGELHRLDVVIELSDTLAARVRAHVDHDATPWFDDNSPVAGRPDGRRVAVSVDSAAMTAGRLRVAALTANFREPS